MKNKSSRILPIVISIVFFGWILNWVMGLFYPDQEPEVIPQQAQAIQTDLPGYPSPPSRMDELDFLVGGVQMNEGDQVNWIRNLLQSGMNTVEVTVYAHQGRWLDNNLWFGDVDQHLVEEIRLAKRAGMNVVLILRLQLDHSFPENKFLWHGMVYPENKYLLNRWFENYTRFARQWARVAEEEGVDVLVIGSEMNALFSSQFVKEVPSLESYFLDPQKQIDYRKKVAKLSNGRLTSDYLTVYGEPNYTDLEAYLTDRSKCKEQWAYITACQDSIDPVLGINRRRATQNFYWEKLIWNLRTVYHGKMTVAANFDNYHEIKFWKELDFIGINAYFPLRKLKEGAAPNEAKMAKAWRKILADIETFRDTMEITHLPILFTELGYTSYAGSSLAPWQGSGFSLLEESGKDSLVIWDQQQRDISERNMATRALLQAVQEMNFPLAGILYWKFTSWKHQEKEDPFALHIGPESQDSLQSILLDFKKGIPKDK